MARSTMLPEWMHWQRRLTAALGQDPVPDAHIPLDLVRSAAEGSRSDGGNCDA
jgi:hypothetical protein